MKLPNFDYWNNGKPVNIWASIWKIKCLNIDAIKKFVNNIKWVPKFIFFNEKIIQRDSDDF